MLIHSQTPFAVGEEWPLDTVHFNVQKTFTKWSFVYAEKSARCLSRILLNSNRSDIYVVESLLQAIIWAKPFFLLLLLLFSVF